jgi:hypothetical protein
MTNIFHDQQSFMSSAGQQVKQYNEDQVCLYAKLIKEESSEFIEESWETNIGQDRSSDWDIDVINEHTVKEACDVIVVATGYLISALGAEGAQKAWDLVHANNVKKTLGNMQKRADGKLLKGDTDKAAMKAELLAGLRALVEDYK